MVPEWGQIGIFNRSHYEDVLIVRVHDLVAKPVWSKRYQQINEFERMLSENHVRIVKILLYIDKEEQAKRFGTAGDREHDAGRQPAVGTAVQEVLQGRAASAEEHSQAD